MISRTLPLAALCLLFVACKDEGKTDDGKAETKDGKEDAKDDSKDAKSDAKADGKDDGKDDGNDDGNDDGGSAAEGGGTPASTADGDGVIPADAIKECPKSLSGTDEVSRVITKECGTVAVTGNYKMEGGSLILQPGATLAFADGVGMQIGYAKPSKLIVNGTKEEPVTFTASGDKVAGVWNGIEIYGKGARSSIAHAVIEWAGTKQALLLQAEDVTVEGVTIKGSKELAVKIDKQATLAKFDGNTFEETDEQVIRIDPQDAGGLGKDNKFPEGGVVQVVAGRVEEDTTWQDIGAPWHITGKIEVRVEAGNRSTLTVEAGNELSFDGDARMQIGYAAEGTVKLIGTADAPVLLRSDEREEAGAWPGLEVYSKGEIEVVHAHFKHAGKDDKKGALYIDNEARMSLSDSTFEDTAVGVVIKGKADVQKAEKNTFKNTPKAMVLAAKQLAKLAGDNVYEGEPVIELEADRIEEDAKWEVQKGAKVELNGRLEVKARLTIAEGTKIHVKDGQGIQVGYAEEGALEMVGTEEAPIELVGQRDDSGTWDGIVFYSKAHGNKVEHVKLRNAGGKKASIEFQNDSDGTVKNLSCDKCSVPALTWTCKSNVEQSDVSGADGTPKPVEAPVCK